MEELTFVNASDKSKNKGNMIGAGLIIGYSVIEILNKTIFSLYFQTSMERGQCILAFFLIVYIIYSYLKLDRNQKKAWIYKNVFVWIYFIIRLLWFVHNGFEYTVMRSMLFEIVYLVVLSEIILEQDLCKRIIIRIFLIITFTLNAINTFFYVYCTYVFNNNSYQTDTICNFALKYTYLDDLSWGCSNSMYSNPNFLGIATALAILLALIYYPKNKNNIYKICFILYIAFSLYCVLYSKCSSAQVGLIIAVISGIIVKISKKFTRKRITIICLICVVLTTGCIYGFIASHDEQGVYTTFEETINYYSSQRYTIWKDCYYSHKEEFLYGCGNITLEKRDRYEYNLEKGDNLGLDVSGSLVEYVGPHNGYIGMISCTGILGFIAFILLLLKKIIDASALKSSSWYLTIIFVLIINLFECMMPISKNFCSLYMFLMLAMGEDNESEVLPLESEESK